MSCRLMRHAFLAAVSVACIRPPAASPEPATPTPEIFIALTQAAPARVRLNDTDLAVESAALDVCDLPGGAQPSDGTRCLRGTLQVIGPAGDPFFDYETLPDGIFIHDDTGAITPFHRFSTHNPETRELRLYFMVPATASAFGLQWPGTARIRLTLEPAAR